MSGMKISLDAAMRARDVSPPDWRDDPLDRDELEKTATADRIIHSDIAEAAASDLGANERGAREPAESEAADSERIAGDPSAVERAASQRGADGTRRRQRRRLRRIDPA